MANILLVEDEISMHRILSQKLQGAFPRDTLLTAHSVEQAQGVIEDVVRAQSIVDVGIVDLRLPIEGSNDVDAGFRVARELRTAFPEIEIIIYSTRNDADAIEKSKEHHCRFMNKRADSPDLVEATRQLVLRK